MNNLESSFVATSRVKRELFTPLGKIYYKQVEQWQRMKIETEALKELGVKRHTIRNYMVSTPAGRMDIQLKALILRTIPEAAKCFDDPRLANLKASFSFGS